MPLGLTLLLLAGGCKREEPPPMKPMGGMPNPGMTLTPPATLEEKEPHAAGKKVYNANACFRCHSMGGPQAGPPMPNKGPDLAKVAGKPGRNADWFVAYVSDPKK